MKSAIRGLLSMVSEWDAGQSAGDPGGVRTMTGCPLIPFIGLPGLELSGLIPHVYMDSDTVRKWSDAHCAPCSVTR